MLLPFDCLIVYVLFGMQNDAKQAVLKCDGVTMGDKVISVAISNPPPRQAPAAAKKPPPIANLGAGKRETAE
jgi:hypothetical protein